MATNSIKKNIEIKNPKDAERLVDALEKSCEYKEKCSFGEKCNMDCFKIEEGDIEFQGKIYSYRMNTIFSIQKGLYKVEIRGKEERYPYSGNNVQGTGAKDIWNLIKYLSQSLNQ